MRVCALGTGSLTIRQSELIRGLANEIDDLHKQLGAAKAPTDKTAIQRQIDATDRQIDRRVYELYEMAYDIVPVCRSSGNGCSSSLSRFE